MTPGALDVPSPNHDARAAGERLDMLILHYTGMGSAEAALARLCDPTAKVSAHYLLDEEGRVIRLVPEQRRAWHAGAACWRGRADINGASLGIELVNPGHEFGYRPFPERQMLALVELCRDLVGRYAIPPRHVLGHSDVAPERKRDPGELFDWRRIAGAGVGLWPEVAVVRGELGLVLGRGDSGRPVAELQHGLAEFGYKVPTEGVFDGATAAVVTAFQRHFRPALCDGVADGETVQRLFALLRLID